MASLAHGPGSSQTPKRDTQTLRSKHNARNTNKREHQPETPNNSTEQQTEAVQSKKQRSHTKFKTPQTNIHTQTPKVHPVQSTQARTHTDVIKQHSSVVYPSPGVWPPRRPPAKEPSTWSFGGENCEVECVKVLWKLCDVKMIVTCGCFGLGVRMLWAKTHGSGYHDS